MPDTVAAPHIRIDAEGRAWIDDTNVKVIEVVLDHLAYGWSPEEMHYQHPDLSLAQIHAALAYYYDHQAQFDREIEAGLTHVEAEATQGKDSPVRQRLRRLGKLA
jgi:uncharacterized protein (DUF433 family)